MFLLELEKRNIHNFTILVTPNFDQKNDISNSPSLVGKLKNIEAEGAELALHGYDHSKFDVDEKNIKLALESYVNTFGSKPAGFFPPGWNLNEKTITSLQADGFHYTESKYKLTYFQGKEYTGLPIVMESYVSNRYLKYDKVTPVITRLFSKMYARLIWNRRGVVRYSLHPREVDNGNFEATLKLLDGFLERGWKPVTYSTLESIDQTKKN